MIGLIGKKVGMTQVFDEAGILTPVTVISFAPNFIVAQRTAEKNGYESVVIGSVEMKKNHAAKPIAGQFPEGIAPQKYVLEMREFDRETSVGEKLGVELFEGVRFVDVIGTSKGKGYQGVMKRHGFGGGRKTHGSKFHREPGTTGNNTTPGKTIKGRKMPGRMGGDRTTVQNLRVMKIDVEKQVLLLRGAVPGATDGFVLVKSAKKKA